MFPFIRPIQRLAPRSRETGITMIRAFGATVEEARVVIKVLFGTLVSLPERRGLFTLTLSGLPTITDGTLPVYISDNRMTKPLLLPTGEQMPASEFQNGEHIMFCYDKPDGTINVVSSEALPTTSVTPAAGTGTTEPAATQVQARTAKAN